MRTHSSVLYTSMKSPSFLPFQLNSQTTAATGSRGGGRSMRIIQYHVGNINDQHAHAGRQRTLSNHPDAALTCRSRPGKSWSFGFCSSRPELQHGTPRRAEHARQRHPQSAWQASAPGGGWGILFPDVVMSPRGWCTKKWHSLLPGLMHRGRAPRARRGGGRGSPS